jgi:glycosyltransferase involved in cell wall biosynthesis
VRHLPRVSVLTPVHNAGPLLVDQIEAVLAQDVELELLVGDDASTDGSWERLRPYRRDPRVRAFRWPRRLGSAAARNALLAHARGRYCSPCDADDLLLPGSLRRQAEYLDRHPEVGVVFADVLLVFAAGDRRRAPRVLQPGSALRWDLFENTFNHGGCLMRTSLLRRAGGYDPTMTLLDDRELALRLSEVTCFHHMRGVLSYVWAIRAGSQSRRRAGRQRLAERIVRAAALRRGADARQRP